MTKHIETRGEFLNAEASVQERSGAFKKELGLLDLALTQILFIIGLTWIGVAGKLGPSHVVLWLTAVVLFYLPLTAVVIGWLVAGREPAGMSRQPLE